MIMLIDKPLTKYKPVMNISDTIAKDLVGIKRGQKVDMIVNYKVVEITKSYTILEISYASKVNDRRTY